MALFGPTILKSPKGMAGFGFAILKSPKGVAGFGFAISKSPKGVAGFGFARPRASRSLSHSSLSARDAEPAVDAVDLPGDPRRVWAEQPRGERRHFFRAPDATEDVHRAGGLE